jgi:hypothetical protein
MEVYMGTIKDGIELCQEARRKLQEGEIEKISIYEVSFLIGEFAKYLSKKMGDVKNTSIFEGACFTHIRCDEELCDDGLKLYDRLVQLTKGHEELQIIKAKRSLRRIKHHITASESSPPPKLHIRLTRRP